MTITEKEKKSREIQEFEQQYQDQVIQLIDRSLKDLKVIPDNGELIDDPDLLRIPEVYSEKGRFFIAVKNGEVVGTVAIKDVGGNFAKLHRMFVRADLHGSGLGQKLFDTAIEFARKQRFSKLKLNTHRFMKRAHHFYERNGFIKVGENEDKYQYEMEFE